MMSVEVFLNLLYEYTFIQTNPKVEEVPVASAILGSKPINTRVRNSTHP
jgi:hypothetical protein